MAEIRHPFTATLNVAHRRALSVRQFGGKRMTEEKGKVGVEGKDAAGPYGPCRP